MATVFPAGFGVVGGEATAAMLAAGAGFRGDATCAGAGEGAD